MLFIFYSLAVEEELGDRVGMAETLGAWGDVKKDRNDYQAAVEMYEQAINISVSLGNIPKAATEKPYLANTEISLGNLERAENLLSEALPILTELGMMYEQGFANYVYARLEKQRGNLTLAQQYYDQSKTLYQQLGAIKDLERIEKEWEA